MGFIDDVEKILKEKLPNMIIERNTVTKNNSIERTAFVVKPKQGDGMHPVLYLDDKQDDPVLEAERLIHAYENSKSLTPLFDVSEFENVEWVKAHLSARIVNRKINNADFIPHIPVTDDMMCVFVLQIAQDAIIRINNHHVTTWGLTVDELYNHAIHNMQERDAVVFKPLSRIMAEMMVDSSVDMSIEEREARIKEIQTDVELNGSPNIFILTTENSNNASILYPDVLNSIREKLHDDLILLPSSTHEFLVMKKADALSMGYRAVKNIVEQVNDEVIVESDATEFLSSELSIFDAEGLHQVYDYDRNISI